METTVTFSRSNPIDDPKLLSLIARAVQGDPESFGILWATYLQKLVVRSAGDILGGGVTATHDVEDVTQMVCLELWKNISTIRDPQSVLGWVRMVARNTAIDYVRRAARRRETHGRGGLQAHEAVLPRPAKHTKKEWSPISFGSEGVLTPDAAQEYQAEMEAFVKKVRNVVGEQAYTMMLKAALGFTMPEIAEEFGMSVGSVKSTIYRARKKAEVLALEWENLRRGNPASFPDEQLRRDRPGQDFDEEDYQGEILASATADQMRPFDYSPRPDAISQHLLRAKTLALKRMAPVARHLWARFVAGVSVPELAEDLRGRQLSWGNDAGWYQVAWLKGYGRLSRVPPYDSSEFSRQDLVEEGVRAILDESRRAALAVYRASGGGRSRRPNPLWPAERQFQRPIWLLYLAGDDAETIARKLGRDIAEVENAILWFRDWYRRHLGAGWSKYTTGDRPSWEGDTPDAS